MAMFTIPKPLKPRGIRFSMPAGYVLGRASPGQGDAELIPIAQLGQELTKSKAIPSAASSPPTVGACVISYASLYKNRYIPLGVLHEDVMMPAATPADVATCRVAPTSNVVFTIVYNPTTYEADQSGGYLGTVTFLAGQTTGTVAWSASPTLLAKGTVLYLYTAVANSIDPAQAVDTTFTVLEILLTADLA